MDYLDFDIEIGAYNGQEYPVVVRSLACGEVRAMMRFPFDQQTLKERLNDLPSAIFSSGSLRRRLLSREEQVVQRFGSDLFDALFQGEVRERYEVSQLQAANKDRGLRIRLNIQEPNLVPIPWEFLYDSRRREFVCLSNKTPLVRYLELPQPIQPLKVTPPISILGMIASPHDQGLLDVDHERRLLQEEIQELESRGLVKLSWLPGQTWRDLQRAMRRGPWHIFHFIGHGGFDCQRDEGVIALVNENGQTDLVTATNLGNLLADHSSLRLVLLNACEGARSSEQDLFSSTAATLIRRGIPAVVAMQYEISDKAAITFTREFYSTLADKWPVDAATAEARKAINKEVTNSLEWGTPALYMRSSDGSLFDLKELPARQKLAKPPTAARQGETQPKRNPTKGRTSQPNTRTAPRTKKTTGNTVSLENRASIRTLKKPLPEVYKMSVIAVIGRSLVSSFSYDEFKRCSNGGYSLALLLFLALDVGIFPFAVSQWLLPHQLWITIAIISFLLFAWGIFNKINPIGIILTTIFGSAWFIIGCHYISEPPIAILLILIISAILSCFRFQLFRWHPKR